MKLAFLSIFVVSSSLLHANEYVENIRELCRLEVSSSLINAKNQVDMLDQGIVLWQQKLARLVEEEGILKKRLLPLQEKASKESFNRQLEDEIEGIQYKLEVVMNQIEVGKKEISSQSPQRTEAEKSLKQIKKMIAPVFTIEKVKTTHAGAYNFAVKFRHKCGRYQYICPLPENHRKILPVIAEKLSQSEPCERYAKVQPPLPSPK